MGYLYLRPPEEAGVVTKSIPWTDADARAELVLDFDADGHLVGIEIFSPQGLLRPDELAKAESYSARS
jgi:hypothetical protein